MAAQIQLLGRFHLIVPDQPSPARIVGSSRRRALIAYLALQPGRSESRERLATLLWGDKTDKQARQSLRQSLLSLRRELEPYSPSFLKISHDAVTLSEDDTRIDVIEFQRLSHDEPVAAAALWQGQFLDGDDIAGGAFEEWLIDKRADLFVTAVGCLTRSVGQDLEIGSVQILSRFARRLAAIDPTNEEVQRALLRLIALGDGSAASLAHAASLERRLKHELGVAAEAETSAVIASIRADATLVAAVPGLARKPPQPDQPDQDLLAVNPASEPGRAKPPTPSPATAPARRRWTRWLVPVSAAAGMAAFGLVWMQRGSVKPQPVASAGATHPDSPDEVGRRLLPRREPDVRADWVAFETQGVHAIAVMPFRPTDERSEASLRQANALTDDLIFVLSRVPAFRVIAHATMASYGTRPVDVARVGADLGVRYIVDGSLHERHGRIRVNVGLSDATNRIQVWTERFERPLAESAGLHDDMLRGIARQLQVSVLTAAPIRPGASQGGDPAIAGPLARGWSALVRLGSEGAPEIARAAFAETLRADPRNASAKLGLAGLQIMATALFMIPEDPQALEEAETSVGIALRANPLSTLALYYRGVARKLRGQIQPALEDFRAIIELNPSFALAYTQIGHILGGQGKTEEALAHLQYAMRLSPKDPSLGVWTVFAGQIEMERGDDGAALNWFRKSVAVSPNSPFSHVALAAVLVQNGESREAARHVIEARRLVPTLTTETLIRRLSKSGGPSMGPSRMRDGIEKAMASHH